MFNQFLRPAFLIPFALITPYFFIGETGVTWLEILMLGGFSMHLKNKGTITHKPLITLYATLFTIGYLIAVINGDLKFDIPFKLGDLKIFYWVLLSYVGFYFGYRKYQDCNEITQSQIFKIILVVLGIFVGSYPFLSDEVRFLLMRHYWSPGTDPETLGLLYSPRFPGLGINANIYAFMALIIFCMTLRSTFEKKISWIYPFFALVILTITGSKTVFGLAIFIIVITFLFASDSSFKKFKAFIYFCIFLTLPVSYLFLTEGGKSLQENIIIIKRISYLVDAQPLDQPDAVQDRFELWRMGMERVELAPLLGIAKSSISSDTYLPYFSHPHNEFIAHWAYMGILGLSAVVILILGLIIKNIKLPNGFFWIGIYLALSIQMFFDAAFQSTRFIPLIFLIIGLNLREIDIYRGRYKQPNNFYSKTPV